MDWAEIDGEPLGAEQRIAIGYMASNLKGQLISALALDQRLGRIVAKTTEPMLGQMRLAWWRDMLAKPLADRPRGDAVLDAVSRHWEGNEANLSALVDGWEHILAEPPLGEEALLAFADGRVAPMQALLRLMDEQDSNDAHTAALRRWALADLAANTVEGDERLLMLRLAKAQASLKPRFDRGFRGLAVLCALARRSLERGGRPLMEGRGAALVALRAGLTGR